MFAKACSEIRKALYATTITSLDSATLQGRWGACTSFMIAPGILVTTAHTLKEHAAHTVRIEVINALDLKQNKAFETAHLIQSDPVRDIALLRIDAPRLNSCVALEVRPVLTGTSCGALGFPHPKVNARQEGGLHFTLIERFQAASVAAYYSGVHESGQTFQVYETDSIMYEGSSGCPGFLEDGRVFGMHQKSWVNDGNPGFSLWLSMEEIIRFAQANSIELQPV
jgi:hypothetical protein